MKKLQIALEMDNVKDMPHPHDEDILTREERDQVIEYNVNDVIATRIFLEKTRGKIGLRRELNKKYNLDCLNFSDSKIGEELMLKLYCEETGLNKWDVKKMRTRRTVFPFDQCIPSYVKFSTPEFNELLDYLKGIVVYSLKNSFKYSFDYKGLLIDLGTGGVHAFGKPGVYKSCEDTIILDSDVSSLYPSLAVVNGFYPHHLGETFSKVYEEGIVKPRLRAKEEGDKVMSDGFKLAANSVYGKSNSEFSWLYDPLK